MSLLRRLIRRLERNGRFNSFSDKLYLKIMFWANMGKRLDLKNPKTYNEKLQWLKLYDRKPEYTTMVDKYEAKKYVAERIGEEYIIPTLGVWDRFDDIDFDSLPDQFVLKCTHDSGGLVICRDKAQLDMAATKAKLERSLNRNYYLHGREWPYEDVKPRILAEAYMEDNQTRELRDYKFFCFDGEVKALFIASDRQTEGEETKFDFFDAEYNHLPFINGHPNAKTPPEKPQCFEEMKELAAKLSKGIPHLRVDFYEVDGKIYFGELTFSHWSGLVPFEPEQWDYTFGSWITLPPKETK
ncbi:MAG: glycosyl transferase [Oscillospiraceae bacterium]|nr:glycosyl transferase [Oscillospiraceae bacterium]